MSFPQYPQHNNNNIINNISNNNISKDISKKEDDKNEISRKERNIIRKFE